MSDRQAEERVAKLRRHARILVIPVLVMIAAAFAIGFSFRTLREPGPWQQAGVIGAIALVLLGLVPLVVWLRGRSTITTARTIVRPALRGSRRELLHHQVTDVTVRRGGLQALFGSGTVRLTAIDGHHLDLVDVPNAVTVAESLRELTGNADAERS